MNMPEGESIQLMMLAGVILWLLLAIGHILWWWRLRHWCFLALASGFLVSALGQIEGWRSLRTLGSLPKPAEAGASLEQLRDQLAAAQRSVAIMEQRRKLTQIVASLGTSLLAIGAVGLILAARKQPDAAAGVPPPTTQERV